MTRSSSANDHAFEKLISAATSQLRRLRLISAFQCLYSITYLVFLVRTSQLLKVRVNARSELISACTSQARFRAERKR
jgi:hypothetical protein